MNHDLVNLPYARSWRDIPQPVKPRALSREGQWRLFASGLRLGGFIAATLAVGWGVWEIARSLQENPKRMPAAAKAVPVKHLALKTDGHLDAAWLVRTLALPRNASLMELDLLRLRDLLLAHGQVRTATLTRNFPDTLEVRLAEREPVVRLRTDLGGGEVRTLLVAKDGVVFEGAGFASEKLEALPWLAPARLARVEGRIQPIAGLPLVADLLERAQRETARLFATWEIVSLAGLEADDEIEVRTRQGARIVFGTKGEFFPQLAKLDAVWDQLAKASVPPARIDLSLGREVPVSFAAQPLPAPAAADPVKSAFTFRFSPPN
ncbi:MAG: FtsQ-type POTRA domain-containing protein [Verrucomicrobia bacterium]|nr:FtsQ-type POTRA domain-containing protein [Verrucomicrobiota bacterium]